VVAEAPETEQQVLQEALEYMQFSEGDSIIGKKVDVSFIGSCTNGRFSDFEAVVDYLKTTDKKVPESVKALIVPGSQSVQAELVKHGYDKIFREHGFEFREAGCSMCLAMNPDKLVGDQICASSSNRNFKGRQGSSTGRTLLMSPVMVAACALEGQVVDARKIFNIG
ncbi:MAG: aconitase family protein, partial [Lentisphaeraceae bacterium]|nr:aconitase family protein [Lentisphaeraceae bacterium]